MTLAKCSYVSNHAAVPLAAMLIKLMYEAVLMANIPIHYYEFIICNHIFCYWIDTIKDNKFIYKLYRSMQHDHI